MPADGVLEVSLPVGCGPDVLPADYGRDLTGAVFLIGVLGMLSFFPILVMIRSYVGMVNLKANVYR